MSDTPRTDAAVWQIEGGEMVCPKFARHLERELNAANEKIKKLEEARLDKMERLATDIIKLHRPDSEAKEAKP